MSERSPRPSGVSLVLLGIGLLLTVAMLTGYRPWKGELAALNLMALMGPILLVTLAASHASRPREIAATAAQPGHKKGRSSARVVSGVGLVLLLVGGCPWIYTPLFYGGETHPQASGMLGFLIFLFIGLPGLIITAVGADNLWRQRRARVASESHPAVPSDTMSS
ncbi:MAG: hypothetical protein WKF75_08700, partial [Singulisphaera sp.]